MDSGSLLRTCSSVDRAPRGISAGLSISRRANLGQRWAALIARRIEPHSESAQPGQPLARGCGRGGDSGLRPRGGNRARQRRLGAWSPLIRWAGRLASGCDAGTSVRTTSSGCARVRPPGQWLRGQSGSRQLDASGSLVSRCTGRLGATWLPLRMHSLSGVERVGLERAAHPRGQGN